MNVKNKGENGPVATQSVPFWILLPCSPLLPAAAICFYLFIQFGSAFELKDAKSFLRTRATWREHKLVSLFFISSFH